jgi:signal peptidase
MPDDSAGTPDPEARLLTLRGDANADNDPAPYLVTSVRIVLWSFPGAARFVVWSSQPQVLAAVTLVASALVTWAFWPRTPRRRDDVADEPTGGPADDDTDPQVTASDQDERPTDGPQVSRP